MNSHKKDAGAAGAAGADGADGAAGAAGAEGSFDADFSTNTVGAVGVEGASNGGLSGQLSVGGVIIGCVGCVIITASSVYTALKMGALPWPTIFTSITALVLLRACGRRDLNEANITQVIMSAGSMVAGGLAFTIPGIWILGLSGEVSWQEMLLVALSGTLLGLVCTALIRKRLVEDSGIEYPIGVAAAETLNASRDDSTTGKRLFGSMAVAAVWAVLRDVMGVVPAMLLSLPIPGVTFGMYNSPMLLAVGFLTGGVAVVFWFAGAVFGNFGIVVGGNALGLWDVSSASGVVSSLGMGLMMGAGLAVVAKDIVPTVPATLASLRATSLTGEKEQVNPSISRADAGLLALIVAAAALLVCFGLELGPIVAVFVVLLTFVTTIMSAQSVGQTGIDPMEIFGLIVLLGVAAFSSATQVQLFFVAGVVAVACGLAGDVMSDFKTGQIIGTNPRTLWMGQVVGALIGTVVSVVVLSALVGAYGTDAFGVGKLFVSAQASVVATMVSGIPSLFAFWIGLVVGIALYWLGLPAMMFGLGVYLPFYMSFSAFLGACVKWIYDALTKRRGIDPAASAETGIVVASGLLGGESIVGVLVALAAVFAGLAG